MKLNNKYICQNCSYKFYRAVGRPDPKQCPLCKSKRWNWFYHLCRRCDFGWLSPVEEERFCRHCKSEFWDLDPSTEHVTVPRKPVKRVRLQLRKESNEEVIKKAVEREGCAVMRLLFQVKDATGQYAGIHGATVRVRLTAPELVPEIVSGVREFLKSFKPTSL